MNQRQEVKSDARTRRISVLTLSMQGEPTGVEGRGRRPEHGGQYLSQARFDEEGLGGEEFRMKLETKCPRTSRVDNLYEVLQTDPRAFKVRCFRLI